MYAYYTSDKELGDERGHIGSADVTYQIRPVAALDLQVDVLHYDYPGGQRSGDRGGWDECEGWARERGDGCGCK